MTRLFTMTLSMDRLHPFLNRIFHLQNPWMKKSLSAWFGMLSLFLLAGNRAEANLPGGGTGAGPDVTITDNGSTVTMANGTASIVITKLDASVHTINYTFNNTGSSQTLNLLSGGSSGGKLYWFQNSGTFITGPFTESVVTNTGDYAEISLYSASATNGVVEIHYSMRRGSPGFYTTAIVTHRSSDGVMHIELRPNIYAGSIFNWMSVDAARDRLMEVSGGASVAVQGAPKECYLWTNGIYAGQYEDKYKYSANLHGLPAWGWSSVGTGGKNIGIWDVSPSAEYYPGGPMLRQLMEHIGTTMLNVFTGNYYGLATDSGLNPGETWSHVYGPYLYYFNSVTNTLSSSAAAQALYNDALAQGAAEKTAWPYTWFNNTNYAPASNRGTVNGKIVIADSGNPNASAANLWVGLVQQPSTAYDTVYDFQQWMKPYQFWVRSDTNGNFSIPNVISGTNYTLYAFGAGTPDTFMSQAQTGGNPPLIVDYPASQFGVNVTGSATNSLGTVTWTPTRVGPTVFEIGYPDRSAAKFRHGDDYWVGDIGPSSTAPSPVWSKWLEYPFDFPNGVNYLVGQSRWSTDWNFIQPVVTDSQGNYNTSTSTITFNLDSAPASGATASIYLGLCSDYYSAIIVKVNNVNVSSLSGLSASPTTSVPSTGYYAAYGSSDGNIREGNNGAFFDERLTFNASALHAGANTIAITFREIAANYFADHLMYDYLRLELTGYVPPAPASVTAFAGNNADLVCWPVTPGATSYNVLRSTTSGSGYVSITNGVIGPVCGSGSNNAVYLDTTAANGTTYYYVVRSVNPTGSSVNSPQSYGVTPSAAIAASAPAAPAGLQVSRSGHQSVTLSWSSVTGANFYSVWRSTLVNTGGGSSNTLSTIILNNSTTNTSFTDTTPTDGSIYSYFVTATGAGGTSGNSAAAVARPLPGPPASLPVSLTGLFSATNIITLNWTAVPDAVGYAIYRATSASGPFTFLQSVTETVYHDSTVSSNTIYYYRVVALNAAGVSANATDSVNYNQVFPASLTAVGSNAQVVLTWPATTGATSYNVKRGTSAGNETVTVATGLSGTSYTNISLINGTTYYYVITATGSGGTSGNSPEASATPFATSSGIWTADADGNWDTAANWSGGGIASGLASSSDFSTLSLSSNLTVTLDSAQRIGGLKFGDASDTYSWTLAGTNVLTLGSSPNINVVNQSATISTPLAGTAGLTKTGPGVLTIGGATNPLTGGATISSGTLNLDYTSATSPAANLLAAANSLTLGGGGLRVNGGSNVVSSQTFAATTLNAGASVIGASPAAGNNYPTVTLGAVTANAGGLVEFNGPATVGAGGGTVASNAIITTTIGGNTAFVGGNGTPFFGANYATVGLYDFAATTATTPYTVIGGSQIAGFYTPTSGTAGTSGNLDVIGNITGWSGQPYLTSLRFNSNIGSTISVASYSTLSVNDFLVTPNVGPCNVSINNNSLRPAGGSSSYGGPFVVWQNNPGGELIFNSTLVNSKVGAAAYVQGGSGTVSITGTSSGYTGQSYLNGGVTLIAGNGSIGAAATGAAVNLNGGTLMADGTFALDDGGANIRPVNLLANGGGMAATAGNTLTVDGVIGSASGAGPLTIGIPASSANNHAAGLLPGTGPGTANTAVSATGTVVVNNANDYTGGTVLQSGTLNVNGINALGGANYGGLTFNGGTLQYAANLTGNNGSADLTSIGTADVTVATGGGTIDLNGNAVTYTGAIGNNGSGALQVKSSLAHGGLTLQGANTYGGTTTISNATLWADNASGSATGPGAVVVLNGGILEGAGTVDGSVTVTAGGTLAPADLPGGLSLGSDLTLAAGSKTVMQIQPSPLANDAVVVTGTFTAGGTLIVTNIGGTNLVAGDSFPLFTAAVKAGQFDQLILPTLPAGLVWNTNQLNVSGTLQVASLSPPAINQISVGDGSLTLTGSGGISYWNYYVLSATNLSAPHWTPMATNQFDGGGNFSWTNTINAGTPQTFFKLQLQ